MKRITLKRTYSVIAGLMLAILTLGKTEANAISVDSFTSITIPPYISGIYASVGIKAIVNVINVFTKKNIKKPTEC